jgi:sulfoxide reductase heme-binding subunit YedZ
VDADYFARRYAKPIVFLACLLPAAWLAAGIVALGSGDTTAAAARALGANPVEKVQDTLGIWGLRLLLVTLAVTPLRVLGGWPRLQLFRRMLGLFAFFYIALHFLWYLFVDQALDWAQLLADVVKRPYVTAGFTAFLLLVPLAATSTQRAMRRLGRRWQKIHRLVYAAAILGCVHFWWQVKADIREPLVYAAIAALLLGWRLHRAWRRRRAAAVTAPSVARARGERRKRDAGEDHKTANARAGVQSLAQQPPAQH